MDKASRNKADVHHRNRIAAQRAGNQRMLGPASLTGDWAKIATDLNSPSTANAKSVLAAANWTTAAICTLTNDQPASACTPAVKALEPKLNG